MIRLILFSIVSLFLTSCESNPISSGMDALDDWCDEPFNPDSDINCASPESDEIDISISNLGYLDDNGFYHIYTECLDPLDCGEGAPPPYITVSFLTSPNQMVIWEMPHNYNGEIYNIPDMSEYSFADSNGNGEIDINYNNSINDTLMVIGFINDSLTGNTIYDYLYIITQLPLDTTID
tara:strand:+ start:1941 stop:2477 length:537 start_codon:yes stop_codon:yes gene_type:complete